MASIFALDLASPDFERFRRAHRPLAGVKKGKRDGLVSSLRDALQWEYFDINAFGKMR